MVKPRAFIRPIEGVTQVHILVDMLSSTTKCLEQDLLTALDQREIANEI